MSEGESISNAENGVIVCDRHFGRDEMNFAEFPLGTLTDRAAPGQKTLVFEDQIDDYGRGERITRRLTISASDKYGLPTSLDQEVILGLIELSREQDFADRRVSFTRYHLRETLGWRDEGRSYHRIDTSLRRWLGVTLYYEKAWWDNAAGAWVDENFHVLDSVTLRRREGAAKRHVPSLSCFTWNEVVFRSFKAGYLKQLDWALFRSLKLPTAKRMYRFLDKRFYHKATWEFDLTEFAFEHIGLSRSYDTGQVKRKLMPAVRELEGAQFLRPLPAERRFVRMKRGSWRIVVNRERTAKDANTANEEIGSTAPLLTDRGVSAHVAKALVATGDEDEIRSQVDAFDRMLKSGNPKAIRNPAGFLVAAIRGKYRMSAKPSTVGISLGVVQSPSAVRKVEARTSSESAIASYLANLPDDERVHLESEAMAKATGLARDRHAEALANEQTTLASLYREAIVSAHVRQLLGKRGDRGAQDLPSRPHPSAV